MFFIIEYENGAVRYGEGSYTDAIDYAESCNGGYGYTITEYESEEDYYNNI